MLPIQVCHPASKIFPQYYTWLLQLKSHYHWSPKVAYDPIAFHTSFLINPSLPHTIIIQRGNASLPLLKFPSHGRTTATSSYSSPKEGITDRVNFKRETQCLSPRRKEPFYPETACALLLNVINVTGARWFSSKVHVVSQHSQNAMSTFLIALEGV